MNNLFKLVFLIFNLISSTTSSVNNFSVPLADTELTMAKNSSEIVERQEPISLYGGTTVQGIWTDERGSTLQRPCTLSFPVKEHFGREVFLTSYACSNTNFFVQDDKGELIQVGTVLLPRELDPSRGLDYALVLVYDSYWSDFISKNVAFTEYLIKSNTTRFDLLAMTISTQPPFANLPVCAYGGLNGGSGSEMTCGEILEFNVTIQIPKPETDGKEFVDFVNVVKVNMTDDYDLGYMGAPVYIPGQIPFDTQIIAHPVGQIVETLAQYNNEEDQDKKIWYYIPIDRILQDSGVELLLGDFSGNEEVSMSEKSSNSKLQERQPNQPILYGGTTIGTRRIGGTIVRNCTLGFAVMKKKGRAPFNQGYLIAGSCSSARLSGADEAFVKDGNGNEVIVGTRVRSGGYVPDQGLDYNVVKVRINYWNPQGSMGILVNNVVVPVVGSVSPPKGFQVCFVGGYSGLVCGWINDLDKTVSRTSPWRSNNQNQYDEEYFQHMVLVGIEENTRGQIDGRHDDDRGAPVFSPMWNPITPPGQPKQLIGARPVGIFAEYTTIMDQLFGWRIPGTEDTAYFTYTPIQRILESAGNLELIETPY